MLVAFFEPEPVLVAYFEPVQKRCKLNLKTLNDQVCSDYTSPETATSS